MKRKKLWLAVLAATVLVFAVLVIFLSRDTAPSPLPPPLPTGPNARAFLDSFFSESMDMAARAEKLHEIRQYAHWSYPGGERGYMESLRRTGAAQSPTSGRGGPPPAAPDFHNWHVGVKTMATESTFLLLQGKRSEALQRLADLHFLGRLAAEGNLIVTRMVGVAICSIAQRNLEEFVFDACETKEECAEAARAIGNLAAGFEFTTPEWINSRIEPPKLNPIYRIIYGKGLSSRLEKMAYKHNEAVARIRLLHMAVAARRCYLETGSFPASSQDLEVYLPGPVPLDPFTRDTEPLRFRVDPRTGEFMCYSIGNNADAPPAGSPSSAQSRKAAEAPAGDAASEGDTTVSGPTQRTPPLLGAIALYVPLEREYPFPAEGLRAGTAEEAQAVFPNGLPHDSFDTVARGPLRLTDKPPLLLFSVGPDNQESVDPDTGQRIQYDPTNGTVSPGDLFMEILSPKE